jgi:serine/threonine protein kinase/WD40 repeat protein
MGRPEPEEPPTASPPDAASRDELDPLDRLAEEFLARRRRGERPSISEFAAREPALADDARAMLEALALVEGLKPDADATLEGDGGPGGDGARREPVPARLGDFRIVREIGRGGMGVVYEAEQESLGRRVALKVLAPHIERSPRQVQRFVREARAAAQLHHTNIVPVFGVGEHDGRHFYAMQFIAGHGLDAVLEEVRRQRGGSGRTTAPAGTTTAPLGTREGGPSPAATPPGSPPLAARDPSGSALVAARESAGRYARGVARVGLQVAEAIEHAHRHGVLHRDIKPSNLLLDADGTAWVTDFGLAKAAADDDLTRTGDLVGTLRYMAPERFRGRCDARSDVYALGLTLYELLALRPAFDATDHDRLIYQVTQVEPRRLGALRPGLPRDLVTVVHKAIEKDPAHRYAGAGALAEDLRRFVEGHPVEARPLGAVGRLARWARRSPVPAALGGIVAALLALTAGLMVVSDWRLRREHAATVGNLERAERAERDVAEKLLESSIAHARASRRSGAAGRRFDSLRAVAEASRLAPARRREAELRAEAIASLALADLRPIPMAVAPGGDPVGTVIDVDPAFSRAARGTPGGGVRVDPLDGDGGGGGSFTLPGGPARAAQVRFGPDGRMLAVKHDEDGRVALAVWDLEGRRRVREVPDGVHADAFDFHPGGGLLAAGLRDGSVTIHDLHGDRPPRRMDPGTVPQSLRFDPAGGRLAVVSPTSDDAVQVRLASDGAIVGRWPQPAGAQAVAWHPSGRSLAVGGQSGSIHLLDAEAPSRPPRVLGGHDAPVVALAFHPSGRLLASASRDGTLRLWDPDSARELVRAPLSEARPLRFRADGRLLGPGGDGTHAWIWEVAEGRECRTLAGGDPSGAASWSVGFLPGDALLVSAGEAGIRLGPLADGRVAGLAAMPGTAGVVVAPDGASLFSGGESGVLRWPVSRGPDGLRVGPPRSAALLGDRPTGRLAIAADGHTLAAVLDADRGRLGVTDLRDPSRAVELAAHPGADRLALSPDGLLLATGTARGTGVMIWDVARGRLARALPVAGGADVRFSPDGRTLVTGSGAEYVLWDTATWRPRRRVARQGAGGLPGPSAFRRDGGMLALARTRNLIVLVEPDTGRELAVIEPPDARPISALGFDPDGGALVAALNAAELRLWDLPALRRNLAALGLDWERSPAGRPIRLDEPEPVPSPAPAVVVEPAPWLEPLRAAEEHARAGRWAGAVAAQDEAITRGATGADPLLRRAWYRLMAGDDAGYRDDCRRVLDRVGGATLPGALANRIAWACALAPGAIADRGGRDRVVALAEGAAADLPVPNRLNTLGAVLLRAGRDAEAVRVLDRARAAHGAGGTPYDAVFLAMAHHRLGHADEARAWLRRATDPAPVAMNKPDESGPSSWIPRLELGLLRRELLHVVGDGPGADAP